MDTSAASAAVAEMISSTSGPSRDVFTSNRTPVQASTSSTPLTITVEQNGAMKHTRKAQYNEAAETDELSGFIQVKGKPRFSSFFTAGIKLKNTNVDETIKQVYAHLQKNGCTVRSVRMVRNAEVSISVKIIALHDDTDLILSPGFWPSGIYCRAWKN